MGGTVVAITGDGFVSGATTVSFGGVPASSVTVVDFNHLTAISPPGRGVVPVTVGTAVGYATLASGFNCTSHRDRLREPSRR